MAVKEIIQLGHPDLYLTCEDVKQEDMNRLRPVIADMHDTVMDFRLKHGFGRAIAAPQIGLNKRLVYVFVDEPMILVNPVLSDLSKDMISLWDNCMSFPFLSVKVKRHKECTVTYLDMNWREKSRHLEGDMSELVQHEVDHLDGILAVQRAIDDHAFAIRGQERN
ncbi:MAG: peptide deformylase [Candidatus Zixiibacteriota bacterium]|nr:MAG: peptide deformylase [candidate division Zixibacteria bacterium]